MNAKLYGRTQTQKDNEEIGNINDLPTARISRYSSNKPLLRPNTLQRVLSNDTMWKQQFLHWKMHSPHPRRQSKTLLIAKLKEADSSFLLAPYKEENRDIAYIYGTATFPSSLYLGWKKCFVEITPKTKGGACVLLVHVLISHTKKMDKIMEDLVVVIEGKKKTGRWEHSLQAEDTVVKGWLPYFELPWKHWHEKSFQISWQMSLGWGQCWVKIQSHLQCGAKTTSKHRACSCYPHGGRWEREESLWVDPILKRRYSSFSDVFLAGIKLHTTPDGATHITEPRNACEKKK